MEWRAITRRMPVVMSRGKGWVTLQERWVLLAQHTRTNKTIALGIASDNEAKRAISLALLTCRLMVGQFNPLRCWYAVPLHDSQPVLFPN